jgi:hypothetical protein
MLAALRLATANRSGDIGSDRGSWRPSEWCNSGAPVTLLEGEQVQ